MRVASLNAYFAGLGQTGPPGSAPETAGSIIDERFGRKGKSYPEAARRRCRAGPAAWRGRIPGERIDPEQGSDLDQIAVSEVAEMPKDPVRRPLAILP